MGKRELLDLVEEHELDIDDPEEFNTSGLRKMIISAIEEQ